MPRAREHDESKWRDLACRMAKQVKCSVTETWKRKRPNCSMKTKSVKLQKRWTFSKGTYTLLQTSTWQAMVEGICTGGTSKVAIAGNPFVGLLTSREALDSRAIELTLLGFDDLVKIAEERLSRKERSNVDKV